MIDTASFASAHAVSLFTREWIEMGTLSHTTRPMQKVSLFTREWIEITNNDRLQYNLPVSLFTREWIEIRLWNLKITRANRLPLYEGVD